MKSTLYVLVLFFLSMSLNAQVGIGTTTPNGALDITSTNDGLLIPRVALTSTTDVTTVITGTESELVYNTSDILGVITPGYYYLSTDTGPWVRLAGSSGWSITGNADIVDGTNFLGTTNNIDVAFRRNGVAAGKIGTTSTSFGVGAASTNVSSNHTTAFGVNALNLVTTQDYNTAFGYHASRLNTGTYSTAIGAFANELSGSANYNTAVGAQSLQAANGGDNTAVGLNALQDNTAAGNSALGHLALANNTTGTGNVAMGFSSLDANITGVNNTAVGYNASGALNESNVTTFGYNAGAGLRAQDNTAIGSGAMDGLTSTASRENTAVGYNALSAATGATVSHNTIVGHQAAFGIQSSDNVAIGHMALFSATNGQHNTVVGSGAFEQGNSSQNTAIGKDALMQSPGNGNVAVGYEAGMTTPGTNNVFIGWQANGTNATTNAIAIGFQANAPASNSIRIGNGAITLAQTQVGWTLISDRRLKSNIIESSLGLDFIKTLRPVSYFKNNDEKKKTEYGFIAQEVEEALNKAGDTNNGLVYVDSDGNYSLRYNDFIPLTVKAVQEQQALIEKLRRENEELKATNADILKRLEALENK